MFFDKYAKLLSNVNNTGENDFVINVYDDEISESSPIMWMECAIEDAAEYDQNVVDANKFSYVIFVPVVEFNDSLFFKMPENRQQVCANALFKRFIKWYKENYDGELISANFANYDLQEKFKVACEKGIFPKESLDIISETSKEEYLDDDKYNMNNRRLNYDETNNSYMTNISFNDFVNEYYEIKNDRMDSENISNVASIYYDNELNLDFEIYFNEDKPTKTDNRLDINMDSIGLTIYEDFFELLENNESLQSKFLEIFKEKLNYVFYGNDEFYVEDFIEYISMI